VRQGRNTAVNGKTVVRLYACPTLCLVLLFVFAVALVAADATPLASIGKIATAFSEGDPDGVLEYFDSQMKGYPELQQKVEALAEQADVSCAIEVVTDEDTGGVHKLDLDWYMQLTPESGVGPLERRRERIQVEMKLIKKTWKVTSMSPTKMFEPMEVK